MAITQATCTSAKVELLKGLHDFSVSGGDVFKLALYTSAATLSAATTAYSATNEVAGTAYVAGGATLTNIEPVSSGTTAWVDFADAVWSASTITARGGLIYNSTNGNRAVAVLDFGVDKTTSGSDFTVSFPTPDANNAILRFTD